MPPRKRASASAKAAAKKTTSTSERRRASTVTASAYGSPELIVIADPAAALRIGADGVQSGGGADTRALNRVATRASVTLRPLFGPEERVRLEARRLAPAAIGPVPDLSVYYHVDAPAEDLADLAEELAGTEGVQGAYVKPAGEPPELNDMAPAAEDAPPTTPDFVGNQLYLEAAPGGVDARYAWTWPGGGGAGVNVIDCEWGWRFDHEDLTVGQGGVVVGTGSTDTNHGTAVIGEISGDRNSIGITGICPDAFIRAAAFSGPTASTIRSAADRLGAGDILLLEIHRAGPRHNFAGRDDQLGYIAIEWWPDDFDAIRYANSRGIIVVEAAGNGAENLDDALYSVRPAGFPASWTNPFNRANRDSGAVVVGAGAPPPGTHGVSWGADRSRLDFSNYGALIDAQGWGREVTTAGYGDLQGGGDARIWYTNRFSGTSSASPIVVGVLGSLQGALRAAGKPAMTPATARAWLRATGSPQQDEPGRPATQRIGNRPDLKALIQAHVKGNIAIDKSTVKDAKDIKLETKEFKIEKAEVKERKEKIEVKEHKRENKEFKNEKAEIKERKEKIEALEGKNVIVDGGGKNFVLEGGGGRKQLVEGGGGNGGVVIDPMPAAAGGLEARLAAVEQSVAALTHFIGADLRPDLGSGALAREADIYGQADSAKQEKDAKDLKDKETLAEG
ncbi:MAG TPA: S8 family serine peptidase [Lapillicoccus sp.]|nr:S8 family serine peptidase [Lapillicoccus sp.]